MGIINWKNCKWVKEPNLETCLWYLRNSCNKALQLTHQYKIELVRDNQ